MATSRSLTVCCPSGLSNRLRVLVSGLAVAEAAGRVFRMVWPRTPGCVAGFAELFVNEWPVLDVETLDPAWRMLWFEHMSVRKRPKPISDPLPDLVVCTSWWFVDLRDPAKAALRERSAELLAQLEPIPAIRNRVAEFRARHFRPTMIGVHLRRGDFVRHRPDRVANTGGALATLDRFLDETPGAGILLCTDDGAADPVTGRGGHEGVRDIFRARYGERVVHTSPRSLDRRTIEGIQDALVDLLLLRATHAVIGTAGSTFSELAAFGRPVPYEVVVGATSAYRRRERRARLTGAYWLVMWLARLLYGHPMPFAVASKRIVRLREMWTKRIRDALHARWRFHPERPP